ncbi:MAG: hypothetical protein V4654_01780 [Bdellovibrionota bacterium]
MKTLILTLSLMGTSVSLARDCTLDQTQEKVLRAAVAIESLNGGGRPLTTELHSYSTRPSTWGVILSYSGVQNTWTVITSEDGCQIRAVYR